MSKNMLQVPKTTELTLVEEKFGKQLNDIFFSVTGLINFNYVV